MLSPSHRSSRRLRHRALRLSLLMVPALAIGGGFAQSASDPATAGDGPTYDKKIHPLVQQYCGTCHGESNPSAGIHLTTYPTVASLQKDQETWRKALKQLNARSMPPSGSPQPTAEERDLLLHWLTDTLNNTDAKLLPNNPGRVLIHRLSRLEYNNTMRDLFGVDLKPADTFPADGGGGGGFDNNADTLFVPPILMERYLEAASQVIKAAPAQRIFFVQPNTELSKHAAARKILDAFAMRAYRRPVDAEETDRLISLFDRALYRGASFEDAVRFALKAILVSPNFLFRTENERATSEPYPLGDYELASRLSYFLWSSMPDDELFGLAAQKKLHDPQVLEAQVRRMLRDPKAHALADSFAGQWLRIRELYTTAQPDPGKYPGYTPALRDAMYNETIDFFQSILQDDASVLRLLDANYTYLNEDLAKHYGIDGVKGPEMRRVPLPNGRRGGVLTMASVLTITSYPQRTSPVLRGKWVLEQIMGAPSPPPPPNAGGLSQDDSIEAGLTFRQRLEKHREKPECASCHARMDPLGFGMENYDAIGRWREKIGDAKVDASGVLVGGEKFNGPEELKLHILQSRKEFIRNLTEKMLAFALGRGLEPYDQPTVKKIAAEVEKSGGKSSVLVRQIVESYPFRYRKDS